MLQITQAKHWQNHLYLTDRPVGIHGVCPELYLEVMGRFRSLGGFDYRQAVPWVAVHAVAKGRGVMELDGRSYEVKAGDVVAFFPGQLVHYYDEQESPWHYTWFVLKGTQPERVLEHCGLDRGNPHRPGECRSGLEDVFREVEQEFGQRVVSSAAAVALGWRLVRELEPRQAETARPSLAERAMVIFEHQYGEVLSVEGIATQLGVSRATLFRAFHAEFGKPPKQVLDARRMDRAMGLLTSSAQSVKEIAAGCGFSSEAYFSRVFKEETGQPPGRWRKR